MPKFHKQNKKRTNPRYFLHESVEREDIIDDIREFSKDVTGSRDTYGDIDKLAIMDVPELEEYFKSLINVDNYRLASAAMQDDARVSTGKSKIGKQLDIPGID